MKSDYLNGYINGLANAAAVYSDRMRYSSFDIYCFDRDDFLNEYKELQRESIESLKDAGEEYGGSEPQIPEIEQAEESARDILSVRLDSEKKQVTEELAAQLELTLGEELGVYLFKDEDNERENASGYNSGWGSFYFVEEMFFVKYERSTVLFMIGNDE